jgi:hypothetical protein
MSLRKFTFAVSLRKFACFFCADVAVALVAIVSLMHVRITDNIT